jgi:hypothetical protein
LASPSRRPAFRRASPALCRVRTLHAA